MPKPFSFLSPFLPPLIVREHCERLNLANNERIVGALFSISPSFELSFTFHSTLSYFTTLRVSRKLMVMVPGSWILVQEKMQIVFGGMQVGY